MSRSPRLTNPSPPGIPGGTHNPSWTGGRYCRPSPVPRVPLLLGGLLLLFSSAGTTDPPGAAPRVRILSPAADAVVSGPTRIEVEVLPGGSPVRKVEVRVDGTLVASFVHPPYHLLWDVGSEIRSHSFWVRVIDERGETATAEVFSRRLPVGEVVPVILVTLYATVVDGKGNSVEGLRKEDFQVLENGIPQEIHEFSPEAGELHIALLIDTSRSMRGGRIRSARSAARSFLEAMAPGDQAMILSFNEDLQVLRDWTDSRSSLLAGLEELRTEGGTALYDAIHAAAALLRPKQGLKGMIVLSDGRDESYDGLSPGSFHTFEEALEAAQRADAILYTIGLGPGLDKVDFTGKSTHREILKQAAAQTGGRPYVSTRPRGLRRMYQQVSRDLRSQYRLSYYSSHSRRDGAWRSIEVRLSDPELRVRTRSGYFAPAG